MGEHINLVKLCVGAEEVEELVAWQKDRAKLYDDHCPRHVTRMWPKREVDLVGKGSLYWVIKGLIRARQRVLRLEERIGDDQIRRCAIVLDPVILRTDPVPRRPFQGWRYLDPGDCPGDLSAHRLDEPKLPASLVAALADIGVR